MSVASILSPKLSLITHLALKDTYPENLDKSYSNILSNFDEIDNLIKTKDESIYRILYALRESLFKISYSEDKLINLWNNNIKLTFQSIFYIYLLFKHNTDIRTYSIPSSLIENISQLQNQNNNDIRSLLFSKMIVGLCKEFEENDEDVNKNESIKIIRENNEKVFNNNPYKKFDMNNEKTIDELYADIIIELIQEYINGTQQMNNIINQINIDNIFPTEIMKEKFVNFFQDNQKILEGFKIKEFDDLKNPKILDFHYNIFKFIFKEQPFYIYEIQYYRDMKKNLLNIIRKNNMVLYPLFENKSKEQEELFYIIKFIKDSEYYNKYITYNTINSTSSNNNIDENTNEKRTSEKEEKKDGINSKILNILYNSSFIYKFGKGKFKLIDGDELYDYCYDENIEETKLNNIIKLVNVLDDMKSSIKDVFEKNPILDDINQNLEIKFDIKMTDNVIDQKYYKIKSIISIYVNKHIIDKFLFDDILTQKFRNNPFYIYFLFTFENLNNIYIEGNETKGENNTDKLSLNLNNVNKELSSSSTTIPMNSNDENISSNTEENIYNN